MIVATTAAITAIAAVIAPTTIAISGPIAAMVPITAVRDTVIAGIEATKIAIPETAEIIDPTNAPKTVITPPIITKTGPRAAATNPTCTRNF